MKSCLLFILAMILMGCKKTCYECKPKMGTPNTIEICGDIATTETGHESIIGLYVKPKEYMKFLESQNYECLEQN